MNGRTIGNLLLITFMLSAIGCANNEVVKKDEGMIPSAPPKTEAVSKDSASPAKTSSSSTSSVSEVNTKQIVPADLAEASRQKASAQQASKAGAVYFGFDSYVLSTESGNILQANFNKLESKPSIQIEGHCDEQGSSEYNLALGEKRAKAAQNYLVTLGYPAARISTISFGKERPASPGHDEVAWAKNRRDELKIVQ
jgi:peptidoglycan-associated lipoprotein